MAKRPKYHFLTIEKDAIGRCLVALPGQTFGQLPVPSGITVQDIGKQTLLRRARRMGTPGEIYFTTTLRQAPNCLKARDIYPLKGNDNVLFQDAESEYQRYLETLNKK